MGALDGDELTALGRHLSLIPADLRCGKLLVYGALFGCLEACLTIAAILTVRSPFVSPQGKRDEAKAARARFAGNQGDLIGDLHAYGEWSELRSSRQQDIRGWCEENFLSTHTLWDISSNKTQYASSLRETGFLPHGSVPASYNAHNSNLPLLRALIAGAFNPQIARIGFPDTKFAPSMSGAVALDPEARTIKYFNQDNGRVFIHPSSSLFDAQTFPGEAKFVAYFNKMATSKVFVRDLTRSFPLFLLFVATDTNSSKIAFNTMALLMFSGPIILDTLGRGLIVDGWLRLRGWARIGVLVSRLRSLLDQVLARRIDKPAGMSDGLESSDDDEVVGLVRKLVEYDGLDQ